MDINKTYSVKELEAMLELAKLQSEITKLEIETQRFQASTPAWGVSRVSTFRNHPDSQLPTTTHSNEQVIADSDRYVMRASTGQGGPRRSQAAMYPDQVPLANVTHGRSRSTHTVQNHARMDPSNPLNPSAPPWVPTSASDSLTYIEQQMASQQEAYASMASAVRESISMPKPEIISFNGDPKDYHRFMRCFEANIERRTGDDGLKLNYLIQFCKGEAKESITNCTIMSPEEGYETAKSILQKRYGRPHTVVRALVQELTSGPAIRNNDGEAIFKMAAQMQRCEMTLEQMGYHSDLNNFETILKIARRLPQHLRVKWVEKADQIIQRGFEPSFHDLSTFLENRARVATTLYGQSLLDPPKEQHNRNYTTNSSNKRVTTLVTQAESPNKSSTPNDKRLCWLCKQNHNLIDCQQFRRMSFDERRKVTREKGLCDNCFGRGHRSKQCGIKSQCKVEGCTWKHAELLHPPTAPDQRTLTPSKSVPSKPEPEPSEEAAKSFTTSGIQEGKVFLRIVPVRVHGRDKIVETYALLDDCSDVSLCTDKLMNTLGIKGKDKCFQITTMSDEACSKKGKEVCLTVSSLDGAECIDLNRVWSVDKIPVDHHCIPTADDLKKWPHLDDVNFPAIDESDVKILIGSDVPEAFWQEDERRGRRKEPYAVKTPLGWTIIGPMGLPKSNSGTVNFTQRCDNVLHKQMEQLWKSDFSDRFQGKSMSVEDKRAIKMYEETAIKVDGHFQIGLPWRRNPPDLKNNRNMAESRMRHLRRRMKGDPELYASYKEVMEGYVSKGHAKKAPPCRPDDVTWYLPHHPVIHPTKRKLRIVFDCAARYKGKSLNDELLQGPDLMNSLVGVLHRFRQKPIAISGDVESMFHQVKVTPSDCSALRFLWWSNDIDEEPEDYQMLVHLFGATSSPSVCCWALRQTAIQCGESYDAKVLATVDRNFYVDDCLVSVDTNEEARELVEDLMSLLQESGFRLTKWVSNSREVMLSIPDVERAKSVVNLDLDELPIERALGIAWNVESDCFEFTSALRKKPATKRGLLSVISSLYDPLGFVAPVTLTAKKLLQELCRQKVGWDEQIDDEIALEWNEWLHNLNIISKISIERCFIPKEFGKVSAIELHIFADASETGYGSVAYLRLMNSKQEVHCTFVMGKSRLAPLKAMTIPRLELSAAVVATRLKTLLEQELDMKIERTTLWTDSTSVLQYIRNETRRFKTFVANRLTEILDGSQPSQWRYVNTAQNPADIASRGLKPLDSERLQVWLDGPGFLREDEANWPQNPENLPELDASEVKGTVIFTDGKTAMIDELVKRYSAWCKLQRAMAWILRFKQYCVKKWITQDLKNCSRGHLTVEELHDAEEVLLRHAQQSSLSKSDLKKLNPTTKDGLIRVGGRLEHAPVEYGARHPIVLPSKHHITSLIIRHHHEAVGHSGCDFVLSSVRQRFWIVKGRASVKREIGQCMKCKKRSAPQGEQFMAPLPTPRVTPDKPPFSYTGVDYFGPLYVKQGRSTAKRYGCLFTCMTTRAVHIEISHSLDTDSFLGALQRFISRRGKPEMISSDNGTNFRGGERELRQAIEQWNETKINNVLLQQEIKWRFNPPGASHMGGVWERMIRTTRKILKVLTNEQLVSDETLLTLMTETEKIINDRPLTPPSSDPRDLEPLTPSKLLLLKPNPCIPPGVFDKRDQYVRRWYKQAQYLADIFWKRWLKEYLPTLQERQKWTTRKRNLKAGDLVLVVDERVSRGSWPLGRVMKTIADKDGDVRSAEVKTAEGYKHRPITKLCFLEADESFDSEEFHSDLQINRDDEDMEDTPVTSKSPTTVRPKRSVKKPERYKDFV